MHFLALTLATLMVQLLLPCHATTFEGFSRREATNYKHQIRSLLALMEMQDFSMTGFGYKSNDTHKISGFANLAKRNNQFAFRFDFSPNHPYTQFSIVTDYGHSYLWLTSKSTVTCWWQPFDSSSVMSYFENIDHNLLLGSIQNVLARYSANRKEMIVFTNFYREIEAYFEKSDEESDKNVKLEEIVFVRGPLPGLRFAFIDSALNRTPSEAFFNIPAECNYASAQGPSVESVYEEI